MQLQSERAYHPSCGDIGRGGPRPGSRLNVENPTAPGMTRFERDV
jgi:hypothetical protein